MTPWLYKAIKFVFVPVLLWQGRKVRRDVLRLPEAEGPREGVAGTGKVRLRILIVGDSSAAGVGAKNQIQALAGRLSETLSQRLHGAVVWQLIARRGDTTLSSLAAVRKLSLHPADVMVTALGVNDVVEQVPVARWLVQLEKLDRTASRRAGVRHVLHAGIPPIHAFFSLPNPLRWVLGTDAQSYNQALGEWVRRSPDRWWLPVPIEPEGQASRHDSSVLMAEDGLHPGPAAYAIWAEQLAGTIVHEIVPRLPATLPTRRAPHGEARKFRS